MTDHIYLNTEKITQRKQQHGGPGQKSFNAIEEFCERFDKAVKNTLAQVWILMLKVVKLVILPVISST